jgi:hypothetical protein
MLREILLVMIIGKDFCSPLHLKASEFSAKKPSDKDL